MSTRGKTSSPASPCFQFNCFQFFGYVPRKGIAGPYGNSIFNFLGGTQYPFSKTLSAQMDQDYASGRMCVPSSSVQWALLPRAAGRGLQPSLLGKQSQGESLQLILIVQGSRRERPQSRQTEGRTVSAPRTDSVADTVHLNGSEWGKGRISQLSIYWLLTPAAVPGHTCFSSTGRVEDGPRPGGEAQRPEMK